MDAMRRLKDNSLDNVITASAEAFVPILKSRQAIIASTLKKTFKYGSTDRHMLDIYYPSNTTKPAPILFFVYGGGFTTGARDLFPDLVYDNMGAFFAQRGIMTIIPDYRLAPQTIYPGPVHDLREAIQFVLHSCKVDISGNGGNKERVYIMGHSAGCAHVVSLLLNEDVMTRDERDIFKGAVLGAGAHGSAPVIAGYYGEPNNQIDSKTPLGLLKSKSPEKLKELLPRLLVLLSENELPFLLEWDAEFKTLLRAKGFDDFQEYTIQGHNHISPNFALSSGEGEEWGAKVINWINE